MATFPAMHDSMYIYDGGACMLLSTCSDKQSACNELQPVTSHLPHVDTLVCAYVYGCRTRAGVPAAVPSCGVCIWLQACACCRLRVLPPHHMPDARASPGRFAKTRRRSCRMLSTAMNASAPKRRSKTSTTRARARATSMCGTKLGRWFTVAIVSYRRRRSARRCCQVCMCVCAVCRARRAGAEVEADGGDA